MFRTDAVKFALIGLMRNLRGITMATNRSENSHKDFLGFFLLLSIDSMSLTLCFMNLAVVGHMGCFLIGFIRLIFHFS